MCWEHDQRRLASHMLKSAERLKWSRGVLLHLIALKDSFRAAPPALPFITHVDGLSALSQTLSPQSQTVTASSEIFTFFIKRSGLGISRRLDLDVDGTLQHSHIWEPYQTIPGGFKEVNECCVSDLWQPLLSLVCVRLQATDNNLKLIQCCWLY